MSTPCSEQTLINTFTCSRSIVTVLKLVSEQNKNRLERKLLKTFDVIVIGAGTGGCLTAKTLAESGLTVCMIERKAEQDIGDKVCGDAIGKHHFDNIGIAHPSGAELDQIIEGIKVYSPDLETEVNVKGCLLYTSPSPRDRS